MLKSKPRDDRFPDHIISQTGIHIPKSGVLFRQVLASGLSQSDPYSQPQLWTPHPYWGFNKNNLLFPQYPHWYPRKRITNLQNDSIGQVQKPLVNFPPLKEISPSPNWPKLGRASNHFNQYLNFFYVVLVILLYPPWLSFYNSKLILRIQSNKLFL